MRPNAILDEENATPIAYENVYEPDDRWEKIQGCEGCERANSCCGNCPQLTPDNQCALHLRDPGFKPLYCIVKPYPSACLRDCNLAFRCTKGTHKGKERHLTDTGGVFRGPES